MFLFSYTRNFEVHLRLRLLRCLLEEAGAGSGVVVVDVVVVVVVVAMTFNAM